MRSLALCLFLAAAPAAAETLSAEIGRAGVSATAGRLAALPSPTAEEAFALAGLKFLGGVERALQLRWQTGVQADWSELPILRLPIPENPAARPFAGADVTALLTGVRDDMEAARGSLAKVQGDFGLEIDLNDLWFDINDNGLREDGESMVQVSGIMLAGAGRFGAEAAMAPVVRFDAADADWLAAYTHFLSAFATLGLAFDPAPEVDRIAASARQIKELMGDTPPPNAYDMMFGRQVDRVAMILLSMEKMPDPELTKAAHGHLLGMIQANRAFWAKVEAETDNDREWVPNDKQGSALGLRMPEGTGARWQAVLADAEAMLTGEKLLPHWRLGAEAGLNLRRMFEAPQPVNLIAWVQGEGLLPYAEKGTRISMENWWEFERLVQGDAMLFAVFLN
jgi:hypothetical protein